ncbi:4Fe-4S binding protein [Raoultibacter phocaeensis]|uniref:4Fe-4S binding protein n=1 Tax=Raoultibacter phocaeensis TaxID=2479841 RepID=UPI001117E1B4|nr:4Fe-4S binding protein [Raoultibacter phocaeensis]
MDAERFLRFLHEDIRECAFATIGGDGRPAIRIIDLMLHDRDSVYFLTARGKNFYRELTEQGFVAVTGQKGYRMVSLRGFVRQVEHELIDTMFEQNPDMAILYPGETRHVLEPFQLFAGKGEYLDLTVRPVVHETFAFGDDCIGEGGAPLARNADALPDEDRTAAVPSGSYFVTDLCTGCRSCLPACPQDCIVLSAESPKARIESDHCLRCGACAEICPHSAIERSA